MSAKAKTTRQSVSLPAQTALRVRTMAKSRRISATRMITQLVEQGLDAEHQKQQDFFALAERFRGETDPQEARKLGDQLGRLVFGG